MPKICKKENCSYNVFSNGYCKAHQYLRPDYKPYVYKRKPTGELGLFEELWKKRKHISFLSGKDLPIFDVALFAHVLEKAQNKFPKWKLNPENIILLTKFEHHLFDNGTKAQREKYALEEGCSWEPIYSLYNKLKEAYEKEFGTR